MLESRGGRLTRRNEIAAAAVVMVGACIAAAALGVDSPPGKSGGGEATSLVLVSADRQGRGAVIADQFARRVEDRSHGSLRVQVTYASSRTALDEVRSESAQLAIVPSEAFGALDVKSLDALRAPFLIGTDDLAARATGARFAEQLLSGLPSVSLEGLGLVPESLYRQFGFLKPLVSPADFSGIRIRAPRTPAIREVLRDLDAEPVAPDSGQTDTAVFAGFGLDRPGRKASDLFPRNAYTASNVALFPKVDVLAASSSALERLTAGQRKALRQAAGDVRADVVAGNLSHASEAEFCRTGGSIVEASPSELGALRKRTASLVEALSHDATTRALIAEIGRLDPGRGASCSSGLPARPPEAPVNVGNDVRDRVVPPAGSYRRAFGSEELRALGATAAEAGLDEGVLTLTFWGPPSNRHFALEWQGSGRAACRGVVFWPDGVVELVWNPGAPCSGYAAFRRRTGGGDLRVTAVGRGTEARWARILRPGTWKRVDCAPLTAWGGIDPGRTRPCPGGAERQALSRTGRNAVTLAPNGDELVLETMLTDAQGLVIGKRDGTDLRWLTHSRRDAPSLRDDAWPVFSPDGRWIAFIRARWQKGKPWGTEGSAIFVITREGTRLQRLTPFVPFPNLPTSVGWSPTGGTPRYVIKRKETHLTWLPSASAGGDAGN
jgi:TRAP-type C4-dicarboxylate transport system substrate-binding protein